MLDIVRLALRRTTTSFDSEIEVLIADCRSELTALGVIAAGDEAAMDDPQIQTAVIAYCKWKFGDNDDADRWEHIYHDKVTKLMYMSDYGLRGCDHCGPV